MDIIENNPQFNWDWEEVSKNPNLTLGIIQRNQSKKWEWSSIMKNSYLHNEYYVSEMYKKKLVKQFLDNCWEDLTKISCHPNRILNWNTDYLDEMIEIHRNKLKVQNELQNDVQHDVQNELQHEPQNELDDKPEDDIYVKECKKYGINPDFY
jgi:hypothetical protein